VQRYFRHAQQELGVRWSEKEIPEQRSWLKRIVVASDGNIWLMRADVPKGSSAFDVYDKAGRAVAQVRALGQHIIRSPIVHINGPNFLWGVVEDDNGVPCLTKFRIGKQ
jgi:hypothetical protein